MKKKLSISVVIFSLFLAAFCHAQVMRLVPREGFMSGSTRTDSTSFYQRYYFEVPEECTTDTLQLLLWLYSSAGTPHIKLRYFYAMRIAPEGSRITRYGTRADTYFKLSPDSVALSDDFSTEGLTGHMVVGAAKDTLENGLQGMKIWPDAICVAVQGTTNNRSDTRFALKLIGRKSSDPW